MRFVVTIPIHMGAMKVRRKVRRGNSFSSERSSETTAISSGTGSGTHPHKVLGQAKRQRRAWGHPYIKQKHTRIRFKCVFCEKTTKFELKTQLSIDLSNLTLINGCVKQSFDKKCRLVALFC